jgi:hypothetical protein
MLIPPKRYIPEERGMNLAEECSRLAMQIMTPIGFPGTSEKFRTLDHIPFVNHCLQALVKNVGILLANCPKLAGTSGAS